MKELLYPRSRHAKSPAKSPFPAKPAAARPSQAPDFVMAYRRTLNHALDTHDWTSFKILVKALRDCWADNRQVFLCGNGGSAANAIHLANDLLYGIDKPAGRGLRVTALPANPAVMSCLANDVGYEDVFAQQLTALAQAGDLLLAFSGSGNSPNIVKALRRAREIGMTSFAILGFSGGASLPITDHPIYFPVYDMQVSEDLQIMVGHMIMQWLSQHRR